MSKKIKTGLNLKKEKVKLFSTEEIVGINGSVMSIFAGKEASIEGCRGVVDYYDNLIKLKVDGGSITFHGCGLEISNLTDDGAVIRGKFENIEFNIRGD